MTELEYNSSCWGLPVNSHQVNLLQIGILSVICQEALTLSNEIGLIFIVAVYQRNYKVLLKSEHILGKRNYRVLVRVSVCVCVCFCTITRKEIDLGTRNWNTL